MATEADDLKTIRASYIATLKTEAAYQAANGPKPSYSIDGESVNWDAWRDSMLKKIEDLTNLIQAIAGPFSVRSRGRA